MQHAQLSAMERDARAFQRQAAEIHGSDPTPESYASAMRYIRLRNAKRRALLLARKTGQRSAAIPVSVRGGTTTHVVFRTIQLAPRRLVSTARVPRRSGTRPAGHRRTAASSSSSGADPGDPEPAPPSELRLWRHPRYGACSTSLLRVLLAAASC